MKSSYHAHTHTHTYIHVHAVHRRQQATERVSERGWERDAESGGGGIRMCNIRTHLHIRIT